MVPKHAPPIAATQPVQPRPMPEQHRDPRRAEPRPILPGPKKAPVDANHPAVAAAERARVEVKTESVEEGVRRLNSEVRRDKEGSAEAFGRIYRSHSPLFEQAYAQASAENNALDAYDFCRAVYCGMERLAQTEFEQPLTPKTDLLGFFENKWQAAAQEDGAIRAPADLTLLYRLGSFETSLPSSTMRFFTTIVLPPELGGKTTDSGTGCLAEPENFSFLLDGIAFIERTYEKQVQKLATRERRTKHNAARRAAAKARQREKVRQEIEIEITETRIEAEEAATKAFLVHLEREKINTSAEATATIIGLGKLLSEAVPLAPPETAASPAERLLVRCVLQPARSPRQHRASTEQLEIAGTVIGDLLIEHFPEVRAAFKEAQVIAGQTPHLRLEEFIRRTGTGLQRLHKGKISSVPSVVEKFGRARRTQRFVLAYSWGRLVEARDQARGSLRQALQAILSKAEKASGRRVPEERTAELLPFAREANLADFKLGQSLMQDALPAILENKGPKIKSSSKPLSQFMIDIGAYAVQIHQAIETMEIPVLVELCINLGNKRLAVFHAEKRTSTKEHSAKHTQEAAFIARAVAAAGPKAVPALLKTLKSPALSLTENGLSGQGLETRKRARRTAERILKAIVQEKISEPADREMIIDEILNSITETAEGSPAPQAVQDSVEYRLLERLDNPLALVLPALSKAYVSSDKKRSKPIKALEGIVANLSTRHNAQAAVLEFLGSKQPAVNLHLPPATVTTMLDIICNMGAQQSANEIELASNPDARLSPADRLLVEVKRLAEVNQKVREQKSRSILQLAARIPAWQAPDRNRTYLEARRELIQILKSAQDQGLAVPHAEYLLGSLSALAARQHTRDIDSRHRIFFGTIAPVESTRSLQQVVQILKTELLSLTQKKFSDAPESLAPEFLLMGYVMQRVDGLRARAAAVIDALRSEENGVWQALLSNIEKQNTLEVQEYLDELIREVRKAVRYQEGQKGPMRIRNPYSAEVLNEVINRLVPPQT